MAETEKVPSGSGKLAKPIRPRRAFFLGTKARAFREQSQRHYIKIDLIGFCDTQGDCCSGRSRLKFKLRIQLNISRAVTLFARRSKGTAGDGGADCSCLDVVGDVEDISTDSHANLFKGAKGTT